MVAFVRKGLEHWVDIDPDSELDLIAVNLGSFEVLATYIPPSISGKAGKTLQLADVWDELAQAIATRPSCVLIGDLNAHIGPKDAASDVRGNEFGRRVIQDTKVTDDRGKCLLAICLEAGLVIANGRLPNSAGMTFGKPIPTTTLDYVAASRDLFPQIESLSLDQPYGTETERPLCFTTGPIPRLDNTPGRR